MLAKQFATLYYVEKPTPRDLRVFTGQIGDLHRPIFGPSLQALYCVWLI